MSLNSAWVNDYARAIVTRASQEVEAKVASKLHAEIATSITLEPVFSAAAIGRAAAHLEGNPPLALTVISSAFGVVEGFEDENPCPRCAYSAVIGVTAIGLTEARAICPTCGIVPLAK
jgi:hypothetical protein